jgi:hypothetical protein
MNDTTLALQARLWQMYGDERHPAEWDGHVYGGGKLSQRFWEYHKTIEALDLNADSVVLDIGGGSPVTGVSLLVKVLAGTIKRVIVVDASLPPDVADYPNVICIPENASYDRLASIFEAHPEITHVTSVSVFEHIPHAERIGITLAINEHFRGGAFVVTVEFHATTRFFQDQLTTKTLSDVASALTGFVLVSMEASPIFCEDAMRSWKPIYARLIDGVGTLLGRRSREQTPPIGLWKPLLLKFLRMPAIHARP